MRADALLGDLGAPRQVGDSGPGEPTGVARTVRQAHQDGLGAGTPHRDGVGGFRVPETHVNPALRAVRRRPCVPRSGSKLGRRSDVIGLHGRLGETGTHTNRAPQPRHVSPRR